MAVFKEFIRDSYVVVDLETTGLSPFYDKIIEIAAVKVTDGKPAETFSTLVDPKTRISSEITALTGISNDMIKGAPDISKAMPEFLKFAGDSALLGHNIIRFDLRFLQNYAPMENYCIDTLNLAQHLKADFGGFSLTALCGHYGVINDNAHRALSDCLATHEVYLRLKDEYMKNGAFFTMAANCGRKLFQQNISEKCSVGTELNVTRNEKGLLLSAGEFPVGTVSGSKQKEYEHNEDIVKKVTVSKITEGANSKLLLTAEVTVGI